MELSAGDRLGKYEIVGRLAAGGMAEVYLAKSLGHAGFAKTVAIKRMLPELAAEPGFREMFMQEASVAARLNHANIVQIFDFAEERGELYLAMEFVHGVTLRQLMTDAIHRNPDAPLKIPPVLAAHVARGVARALSYAWTVPDEQGKPSHLIHRDVTPHNILVSYEGDVKLADFGIAKPADRFTSVGVLKGKLVYMSPEQVVGAPLDARSDLFALGIVLYESSLNLNRHLFDGKTQEEVRKSVHTRVIAPPDRLDPEFPKAIAATIMKALTRDAAGRYQTAAELADALGEAIHRESKSPLETDLAAFMRRVYGEPPAIKALQRNSDPPPVRAAEPPRDESGQTKAERKKPSMPPAVAATRDAAPSVPVEPAALSPAEELARRANDPHASTVVRPEATPAPARSRSALPLVLGGGVLAAAALGFALTRGGGEEPKAAAAVVAEVTKPQPLVPKPVPVAAATPDPKPERVAVEPPKHEEGPVAVAAPEPKPAEAPPVEKAAPVAEAKPSEKPPVPIAESAPVVKPAEVKVAMAAAKEAPKPVLAAAHPKASPPPAPVGPPVAVQIHVVKASWLYVWADAQAEKLEAAPSAELRLKPGAHVVHFGNEDGTRRKDVSLVVHAGKPVRVEGNLETASVTE